MKIYIVSLLVLSIYALFSMLNANAEEGKDKVINVQVINDKSEGVLSKIFTVSSTQVEKYIGDTLNNGEFSIEYSCELGERVVAKPFSKNYYNSQEVGCYKKSTFKVQVTSKTIVVNLNKNSSWAVLNGKNGDAAWIYTEISARYRPFNKEKAIEAAEKAYMNAAKAMNYSGEVFAVHEEKGEKVLTKEFSKYLKQFQKSKNIEPNGIIDTLTLKELSQNPVGKYMFKDFSAQ